MIIPDGFAQLNFIHTGAGIPTGAQWTLGVGLDDFAGSPSDLAQESEIWILDSNLYALVSASVVMTSVLCKYGPNETGPSALEPANEPGTAAAQMVPNTSYLIHKNTSLGGHAGRGRCYVPGVPEEDINLDGVLESGRAAGITSCFGSILASMTGTGVVPVVLHAEDSPLSVPTAITSFSCDTKVATQRRRLRR